VDDRARVQDIFLLLSSPPPIPAGSGKWRGFLAAGLPADQHTALQSHERTGRPLGDEGFVEGLESALGRSLKKPKPGPKKGSAEIAVR
jgi:putative transposase|tara:strand:+ start:260 stop:523 length:264 start_codon:yes stop_codon:yes gene_type:complete